MIELDRAALVRGVAVAAVIAVPAALVGLWASDRDNLGWLGGLAVVVVLAGLAAGAAVAAHRQQVGAPLTHGMLTAGHALRGHPARRRHPPGASPATTSRGAASCPSAVLALVAGAIGGADRRPARAADAHRSEHQ